MKEIDKILDLLSVILNSGDIPEQEEMLVEVAEEIDILVYAKAIIKKYSK